MNSSSGVISGTPSAAGSFSFTITVTDANSDTGSQAFTLVASSGSVSNTNPTPAGQVLQGGTVGTAYSETISAQGGTSPYAYSVTSGALPGGLILGSSSGIISGTPTVTGTFNFTVTVLDVNGYAGSQAFVIVVGSSGGVSNYGFVA